MAAISNVGSSIPVASAVTPNAAPGAPSAAPAQPAPNKFVQPPPPAAAALPVLAAVQNPTPEEKARALEVLNTYSTTQGRSQGAGQKLGNGAWSRGLIAFESKPLSDGMELMIYSGHFRPSDPLTMQVQVKVVYEESGIVREGWVALMPQTSVVPNSGGYEGIQKLVIKKSDVDAYFKRFAPQATGLRLLPGADICVTATWGTGHTWGGVGRDGVVKFAMQGAQATSGAKAADVAGPVERDLSVLIDQATRSNYPVLNVNGASYKSHIESESKARVPFSKFKQVYDALTTLAIGGDEAAKQKADAFMKEVFGAAAGEWKVKPVDKFFIKKSDGSYKKDANGYIETNYFTDLYLDNQARDLAKREMAIRARSIANETLGYEMLNAKPGPGARSAKTNVASRIEVELATQKGTSTNAGPLADFLVDKTHALNFFELMRQEDPSLVLMTQDKPETFLLAPSLHVVGRRYKFEFEHKDGTAFEVSLDSVLVMALDAQGLPLKVDENGNPSATGTRYAVATYGQIEMELNHLNFNAPPAASAANTAYGARYGYRIGTFGPGQESWLAQVSPTAAVSGAMRVHKLSDVSNPSIIDEPSYKLFEKVVPGLQEKLLGGKIGASDGAMPAMQKAAMGTRLAGALPLTAAERSLFAEELAATAELQKRFAVAPETAAAYAKAKALIDGAEESAKVTFEQTLKQYVGNFDIQVQNYQKQIAAYTLEMQPLAALGMRSPKYRQLAAKKATDEQTLRSFEVQKAQQQTNAELNANNAAAQIRATALMQAQAVLRDHLATFNPMSFAAA